MSRCTRCGRPLNAYSDGYRLLLYPCAPCGVRALAELCEPPVEQAAEQRVDPKLP